MDDGIEEPDTKYNTKFAPRTLQLVGNTPYNG